MSIAVIRIFPVCSASSGGGGRSGDGGWDDNTPVVTPAAGVHQNIGARKTTNAYMQVFDSVRLAKATVLIVASCEWM